MKLVYCGHLPTVSVSLSTTSTFLSLYSTLKCSILVAPDPNPVDVPGPGPEADPGSYTAAESKTLASDLQGMGSLKIPELKNSSPGDLETGPGMGGGTPDVGDSAWLSGITLCTAFCG